MESGAGRLRLVVAIAGGVYLLWWLMVELLLPGSYNPLGSRLFVVGVDGALLAGSYASGWVASRLSTLFLAWTCLLVAHYCYLIVGNHGESTWWVGAFVTFAAASMCLQSPREVAVFSVFSLACVLRAAALEGQLRHSIYLPGLATILLLAGITKRSQVIAHDATERAERARRERRKSDEQRFQLAAIVESSGDAIVGTTLDGVIRSWNKAAERLFGYTAEEVVGLKVAGVLPPTREKEPALAGRLEAGEAIAPFQTTRRCKDGSYVDVSVTVSPIADSAEKLVGASIAARDISDWKRAEAEVVHAREEAEGANRELEAFSYSVAHDLRAPLRGIDGFTRILLEDYGGALDGEARHHLQRVLDAAQHMERLIDSLLALGRVTRVSLRAEPVDLSDIARATIARLKEADPQRDVQVVIADGLKETGDGVLFRSVIDNLLGNAWKFSRNQPSARIELGSTEEGGTTTYFVRDDGAGFDMAFASKLFGVFQRLHPPNEYEGTGVGLATVQRIVHRHGGRVWAEGQVGKGACFYFTLGR